MNGGPSLQHYHETDKSAMCVHFWNLSTWEVMAGGSWVQGQPGLHCEFQVGLNHTVRCCLKKKERTRRDNWSLLALPDGMSTGNPFTCHIQYLQPFPPSARYSLHCHPRIIPVNLPQTIRGLLQCPLWFFPPASFVAHTQTPGYSSLFPSRLVSSRLVSSEMTSVITSVSVDFNFPPCFLQPLTPILAPPASAPLTFSLEQASALCLNFPLSLPLQTPAAFVLFWCLRETHAKSPVTLSAGYWLHFKNMMVKLQLRSNWQLCLGGCLQCEWPLALTLVLMHWRASLTVLFRQTPGGF